MSASRPSPESAGGAAPPHRDPLERHRAPRVDMSYELEIDGAIRRVELPRHRRVGRPRRQFRGHAGNRSPTRRFADIDRDGFDARNGRDRPAPRIRMVPNTALGRRPRWPSSSPSMRLDDFSPAALAQRNPSACAKLCCDKIPREIRPAKAIAETDRRIAAQLECQSCNGAPSIRQLESAWRGLHHLVSRTETDEMLKIRILDIGKKELNKDPEEIQGRRLGQELDLQEAVHRAIGAARGRAVRRHRVRLDFDHRPADVDTLAELSKIGAAAQRAHSHPAQLPRCCRWTRGASCRIRATCRRSSATLRVRRLERAARIGGCALPGAVACRASLRACPTGGPRLRMARRPWTRTRTRSIPATLVWANSAYAFAANVARAFQDPRLVCAHLRPRARRSGREAAGARAPRGRRRSANCRTGGDLDRTIGAEAELAHAGLIALGPAQRQRHRGPS